MNIHYKYFEHEVKDIAPFVGAMIGATDCKLKCKGCSDKSLKLLPILTKTGEEVIAEIKSNPNNKGIIFGRLVDLSG